MGRHGGHPSSGHRRIAIGGSLRRQRPLISPANRVWDSTAAVPPADIAALRLEGGCAVSAHLFLQQIEYGTARRPSLQNADFDEACADPGKGISHKFNNLR